MRFTYGTFKLAAREPTFRLRGAGPAQIYANTTQSLRKAVRVYHRTNRLTARQALDQSLRAAYWQTGIGAGKKRVAFDLLDGYIRMASTDGRPTAGFDVKSDVGVGSDVIAVSVDVCLFGALGGYVPRVVLWDTRGCDRTQARLLVAPLVVATDQEYGVGTAEAAQLFDVRTDVVYEFTRAQAIRAINDVASVLARAQS